MATMGGRRASTGTWIRGRGKHSDRRINLFSSSNFSARGPRAHQHRRTSNPGNFVKSTKFHCHHFLDSSTQTGVVPKRKLVKNSSCSPSNFFRARRSFLLPSPSFSVTKCCAPLLRPHVHCAKSMSPALRLHTVQLKLFDPQGFTGC